MHVEQRMQTDTKQQTEIAEKRDKKSYETIINKNRTHGRNASPILEFWQESRRGKKIQNTKRKTNLSRPKIKGNKNFLDSCSSR